MANLIRCRGLHTFGSELTQPEGALTKAVNINVDESGVITPRRGFNDFGNNFSNEDERLKQIFEYKDRLIRHFDTTLQFQNTDDTFTNFTGTYSEIEEGFRIKYQEANRNLYFTTNSGIKKISARNASQITAASITDSGGIKAVDLNAKIKYSVGGFLPPQSKVAYRIVWGTKDNNNNLIVGVPSSRFVLSNTSQDTFLFETSTVTFSGAPTGSNYLLLSAKDITYTVWYQVGGSDTQPNESDTLGTTFIEVDFQGTTTNDERANIFANTIATLPEFTVDVVANVVEITNTETGNIADIAEGIGGVDANVTVQTTQQGSIIEGLSANALVTFSVPNAVNTNYFYQIYRTATTTVTESLTLNDIDPGDEMKLVFEEAVTAADITNGSITVEDIVTESFRNSNVNLYTNPISGQGILQANERPPIAKDIQLFRNSTFYANTKTSHRLQINLLSVNQFTSGTSQLIIGNSSGSRRYTFVGQKEITLITPDSRTNTTASSWIILNSSSDERSYFLWFDTTGSDSIPSHSSLDGLLGIRVDLSGYADTANGSRDAVIDALEDVDDFDAIDNSGDIEITNTNNGNTTDASFGNTAPGGAWAITIDQQGDGEDSSTNEVLLSALVSVSQAIDETARSLISIINQDPDSPVNAFYLSNADSLPGIIQFEAKDLTDDPFYLAVNDVNIQDKFTPTLPVIETSTGVTFSSGSNSPANIEAAGHGLVTGDNIYVFSPDTTPEIYGAYEVTVIDSDNFTVPVNITIEDATATNVFFFFADVVSDNLDKPNRLYFSKNGQPEAVPLLNFIDIGPEDEAIERILALRDNLFVLKTDGIYLITGISAPNFETRLLDNSTNIIAPDSAVILNNQIFCLTTQGVATVTETGVSIISRNIENRILNITNKTDYRLKTFGVAYETDRAYILWVPEIAGDTVATQAYRYNYYERTWSRWEVPATCGLLNRFNDRLYIGDGTRNYLLQERKNLDRTDHSDRNFTLSIPTGDVVDKTIGISNASSIKVGDVILQDQYLTIARYNRLLRKLDIDGGLNDSDYESTLIAVPGDNISVKMNLLNAKLVADDSSGTITSVVYSTNSLALQTEFNNLIGELNDENCDTLLKDYKTNTSVVTYESIISSVDITINKITTVFAMPFLLDNVEIYKQYDQIVQWAPHHFGDPSILKQIREATTIFDQNNFYGAKVAYSSDLSQAFVEIPFFGSGAGYWGYGLFGQEGFYWGGDGNDAPFRSLVPAEKQRCRYLNCKFTHSNARNTFRILGISANVRPLSTRAYR